MHAAGETTSPRVASEIAPIEWECGAIIGDVKTSEGSSTPPARARPLPSPDLTADDGGGGCRKPLLVRSSLNRELRRRSRRLLVLARTNGDKGSSPEKRDYRRAKADVDGGRIRRIRVGEGERKKPRFTRAAGNSWKTKSPFRRANPGRYSSSLIVLNSITR